jgi:hypothetical protein
MVTPYWKCETASGLVAHTTMMPYRNTTSALGTFGERSVAKKKRAMATLAATESQPQSGVTQSRVWVGTQVLPLLKAPWVLSVKPLTISLMPRPS